MLQDAYNVAIFAMNTLNGTQIAKKTKKMNRVKLFYFHFTNLIKYLIGSEAL